MEHLFTPTRRYQDLFEQDRDDDDGPFEYTEVELAVSVEDFLIYHWDWADLLAFVTGGIMRKILWITRSTFLVVEDARNLFDFNEDTLNCYVDAEIQATSGQEQTLTLANVSHLDIPVSTGEVGVFWRAIMTSNSVKLNVRSNDLLGLPSGPILSQFLRESPSLQVLEFREFDFMEEHCRALATLERTDIEVKLNGCMLEPQAAQNMFIEWYRHNEVITDINCCKMGSRIISALSGNNSVKRLLFNNLSNEEEIRSLAQALPGNTGIEHLSLSRFKMSDETWSLLFRSMSRHPRVDVLSIGHFSCVTALSAQAKITRMNPIIKMLQHNTVVRTIALADEYNIEELYDNSILPRLEMNRSYFEVQRQAVKRADPYIRPQLLGRALYAVRYNPNLVFRFLLENVPAFVRADEDLIILFS
jgi:hypothetical protein